MAFHLLQYFLLCTHSIRFSVQVTGPVNTACVNASMRVCWPCVVCNEFSSFSVGKTHQMGQCRVFMASNTVNHLFSYRKRTDLVKCHLIFYTNTELLLRCLVAFNICPASASCAFEASAERGNSLIS